MTSNKGMRPKKEIWPIRMKLSKPFRRQLTHYAEKFIRELFSNISLIKCPTPIGGTKIQTLIELRYKFGSVYTHTVIFVYKICEAFAARGVHFTNYKS